MPEQATSTEDQASEATGVTDATAPEAQQEQEQQAAPKGDADQWAGIPEDHWTRKEIESLRRESASRRTENKELKDRLDGAKTADEVASIISDYTAKIQAADLTIAKLNAARTHKLPDDLIDILHGETEAEVLAHAEKLAPYVTKPRSPEPLKPTGGRDPRSGSDDESAEDTWAKIQARKARKF